MPSAGVFATTSLDSSAEWISAILAVLAAAVYVAGMGLQQKGNLVVMQRAAAAGEAGDAGARRVLANPIWWAGMATMVLGFGMHAAALGMGSLSVVQPLQVTEIIFMVPVSAWVAHTAIRRQDWLAALLVAVGLGLFLVSAQPAEGDETAAASAGAWLATLAVVAVGAVALYVVAQRLPRYRAALLGAMTGIVYGLQGAVLKEATGELGDATLADVATWWALPAVVAINVAAIVGQNLAMRAGRLSAALSTLTVTTPAVSTVIGLVLFGESLSTEPLNLVGSGVGIVLTVAGVVRLAASPALLAADETAAEIHDDADLTVATPYFEEPAMLAAERAARTLAAEREDDGTR